MNAMFLPHVPVLGTLKEKQPERATILCEREASGAASETCNLIGPFFSFFAHVCSFSLILSFFDPCA
jgi:hypothetical protein